MNLQQLFEQYIKAGIYLKGWRPKTAVIYRRAFTSFQQSLHGAQDAGVEPATVINCSPVPLTKAQLEAWIVSRRQAGMSPAGVNIYIRAMNALCAWLKAEGHVSEQIILQQIRIPERQLLIFSEREIRALLTFKPKRFMELRIWTLINLLVDTGLRIDEALSIETEKLDLDNLLITVIGKGNRERKVPISLELRKVLFRYQQMKQKRELPVRYLFCTKSGLRLRYRNVYRDIKTFSMKLGIAGDYVRPHCFRHFFAVHYIKSGGSIVHLSRILGHSSITTTQLYLRSMGTEHLGAEHSQHSALGSLRG